MTERFDPYHKWLGIPPAQQPPTHYRLLGIEAFESDREVIDAAANQRMAYLQDLAGGEHIAATQTLLNEVAAARRCLLNPGQKAAYDATLRAKVGQASSLPNVGQASSLPNVGQASSLPNPAAGKMPAPQFERASSPVGQASNLPKSKAGKMPAPRYRKPAKSNRTMIYVAAIALTLLIAAGGVGAVVFFRGGKPEPTKPAKAPVVAQATLPAKTQPAKTQPARTEPKPPPKVVPVATSKAPSPTAPAPPPPAAGPAWPPVFHFMPKSAVLDEICELLFLSGRYHLFYVQHAPGSPAKRSWGHAVTRDLWNWQEEPEPFAADAGGAADAGSVVLDSGNTSGFGTAAQHPLVAVYTDVLYRDAGAKKAGNTIGLAYSVDDGKTWTKYAQNPVLAEVKPGNKHPRVFWHADTKRWCMLLFLGPAQPRSPDGRLAVFSSPNLREWTAHGEFDFPGGHDAPELCEIPLDGRNGSRWCLLSRNGRYHVVAFDGKSVRLETRVELLDRGPHAVAPRAARLADGRLVLLGLLKQDGSPPTHHLLTPVQVWLANPASRGPILRRTPIREMAALRENPQTWKDVSLQPAVNLFAGAAPLEVFDFDLELEATSDDAAFDLQVRGVPIRFDARTKRVTVGDRDLPAAMAGNMLRLALVVDRSSLEVYTGDGMHTLALPLRTADRSVPTLTGTAARVVSLRVIELRLPTPPGEGSSPLRLGPSPVTPRRNAFQYNPQRDRAPLEQGVRNMRPTLRALTFAVVTFAPVAAPAGEPDKVAVEMYGHLNGRGFAMAECGKPVYGFQLTAQVDKVGTGAGTLTLDPTPPLVDEFGHPATINGAPAVKLDITLKYLKKKNWQYGGVNGRPLVDVETRLFEVAGPKVTSRLTLAVDGPEMWTYARLMLADKDGKERFAVAIRKPPPPEPCHPGCFPAGTPIQTPAGARAVEDVRAGDVVTTIGADGKPGKGKVASVFVTDNRLIQVQTDAGTLTTTTTQPLALSGGGLRAAGELKPGDRIDTWDGKQRKSTKVTAVADTGRQARVYNLVLGDPVLFVAGGFLARSKPPAPAVDFKKP